MKIDSRLKSINVICYSGYKTDERPIKFTLRERTLLVEEIIDRWYDPTSSYFKVLANDKNVYLIRCDHDRDLWTVEKIMHSNLF
ncbi:MAG: hypothetical protein U9R17_03970 [Thermodesulfobacteriota bacterium]|nr:hypothetical protein [Thermodesulfobacteriota bacterium]